MTSLILLVAAIVLIAATADAASQSNHQGSSDFVLMTLAMVMYLGSIAGLLTWPFLALWLKYSGVHASRMTARSITLAGVSSEFVEAVRVYREGRRPGFDRAEAPGLTKSTSE